MRAGAMALVGRGFGEDGRIGEGDWGNRGGAATY